MDIKRLSIVIGKNIRRVKTSAEIDRRRLDLRESNELSRSVIVEAKQKDETVKAIRKQLDDKFRLESIAEVNRKRVAEEK